jgi:hypothetical protein
MNSTVGQALPFHCMFSTATDQDLTIQHTNLQTWALPLNGHSDAIQTQRHPSWLQHKKKIF